MNQRWILIAGLAAAILAAVFYFGRPVQKEINLEPSPASNQAPAPSASNQALAPAAPNPMPAPSVSQCPDPIVLKMPVDINKVTSVLYPGQVRGGDFKRHGGFRFDNSANDEIEVRAPMDAVFSDASRYIEMGEVQYLFDFQTACGIRYQFDHFLTLAPKFAAAVKKLPEAKESDSRTSRIGEEIHVEAGEIIAIAVGVKNNVFVDFGVYDTRNLKFYDNPLKNPLCWFDLLSVSDVAKIKSLPSADSQSGTQSEYCK